MVEKLVTSESGKDSTFPERLRTLLEAKHETAASLARAIGISPQAVGKWLKGGAINYSSLRDVARHLGVNWVLLGYGEEALRSAQVTDSGDEFSQHRRAYLENTIANERRLQIAVDLLRAGVVEEDLMTGACYWSPLAREHLCAPFGMEATHENFRALLSDKNKPLVDALYNNTLKDDLTRVVFKGEHKHDAGVTIDMTFEVLKDSAGLPVRIVGVITRSDARALWE